MYESILLPLGDAAFGEWAAPTALSVARRSGAALHLVHVDPWLVPGSGLDVDERHADERRAAARRHMTAVAARLSAELGRDIATHVVNVGVLAPTDDSPPRALVANALAEYAARAGTDLVIMSTHGLGGLKRAWTGSVADALVRQSGIPVLLQRVSGDADGEPAWDDVPAFRHVLVPLDGFARSEAVLPHALALGRLYGARLTLLRVVPPASYTVDPYVVFPVRPDTDELRLRRERAEHRLEAAAAPLRAEGTAVRTVTRVDPVPSRAILDVAREDGTDLIALATRGADAWSRALLGSVADRVARNAEQPVLLQRARAAAPRERFDNRVPTGYSSPRDRAAGRTTAPGASTARGTGGARDGSTLQAAR